MMGVTAGDERRSNKRRVGVDRRNWEVIKKTAATLEEERRQDKLRRDTSDRRRG